MELDGDTVDPGGEVVGDVAGGGDRPLFKASPVTIPRPGVFNAPSVAIAVAVAAATILAERLRASCTWNMRCPLENAPPAENDAPPVPVLVNAWSAAVLELASNVADERAWKPFQELLVRSAFPELCSVFHVGKGRACGEY